MEIDKTKIKEKLKIHLKRDPTDAEVINGANDVIIINEIIADRVEELEKQMIVVFDNLKIKK